MRSLIAQGVVEAGKECIKDKMLKLITLYQIFKNQNFIIKLQNFVNQKQNISRMFFKLLLGFSFILNT